MLNHFDNNISDAIPRASEWYAQVPFDPTVVAFVNSEGNPQKYMNSPLDEMYLAEPIEHATFGTIPPEEREVMDTLTAMIIFQNRVTTLERYWSKYVRPTASYEVAQDWLIKSIFLCTKSREHRAAFCRISNNTKLPKIIRVNVKRIIDHCDKKST